jgi:hypothetical protein
MSVSFNIKNFKLPMTLTKENIDILMKENEKNKDKILKESMMYV